MPIDTANTSGKSARFENVGDKVDGLIISAKDDVQQRDMDTGELEFWPDGKPKYQWVIVLTTDQRDPDAPDDDGNRTVYAKGGKFEVASGEGESMQEALRSAVKVSGARFLEEGGRLQVAHTGLGKKKKAAYNAPKLYKAKYTPPAAGLDPFAA